MRWALSEEEVVTDISPEDREVRDSAWCAPESQRYHANVEGRVLELRREPLFFGSRDRERKLPVPESTISNPSSFPTRLTLQVFRYAR